MTRLRLEYTAAESKPVDRRVGDGEGVVLLALLVEQGLDLLAEHGPLVRVGHVLQVGEDVVHAVEPGGEQVFQNSVSASAPGLNWNR